MAISKNAVAGGITALGGTGAVAGVVIANQNKGTIGEKFKEITRLPKANTNELWSVRISNSNQDAEIKELFKGKTEETDKISALQQWCESKLNEKTTEELSKKFQKFCTYTIKEKMGEWALTTSTNQTHETEYKELVIKHKDNNETEQKLKDIKTQDEATAWTTLKSWCEEQYNKGYEGENELWNLVNKFCKKPTIQDKLKGTELPENLDDEWTSKSTTAASSAKEEAFKNSLSTGDKKDKLKKWCSSQYTKTFDSKVDKKTDGLLEEIKKYCALTIKEKLTTQNVLDVSDSDTADKDKWQKNAQTLKNYTVPSSGKEFEITDDLKEIKDGINDHQNDWKPLRKWCKSTYEKGYKNDNLYKLADKFCKKTS